MPLMPTDVESELSYAYLHAVAAHAGYECALAGRHSDNAGVDARIHARGRFGGHLTDITIEVQLKATKRPLVEHDGKYSFPLPIGNYESLRSVRTRAQRLLVVLLLPADSADWLSHSAEELAIRRCAYWIALRGAPASTNTDSQTVYIPKANIFSVTALNYIVETNSNDRTVDHA